MTYIGYIVNRDTASVEIYTAETFEDLEKQIDERYAQFREELDLDDPYDDYDPLGEDFDWNYVQCPDFVPKAKLDEAREVATDLAESMMSDYVQAIELGWLMTATYGYTTQALGVPTQMQR